MGTWAVLSTGAVLVDLPGLIDANVARAKVAEACIQHCNQIAVVAPIKRAGKQYFSILIAIACALSSTLLHFSVDDRGYTHLHRTTCTAPAPAPLQDQDQVAPHLLE
jgi:hypothetical protein